MQESHCDVFCSWNKVALQQSGHIAAKQATAFGDSGAVPPQRLCLEALVAT
jgi:hypothetical protein